MLTMVLLIVAFLCFIGSAANYNPNYPRMSTNLIGLGLAFWILTLLIARG